MPIASKYALYHMFMMSDATYRQWLDDCHKKRRDRRVPRCAVQYHSDSPFRFLYESGNQQAMINCTGHDHYSYRRLVGLFHPLYKYWTFDDRTNEIRRLKLDMLGEPYGKPRHMDAIGCLGLVLMWYRTRGSCSRSLALMFGLTSSPMYKWLKFGQKVLVASIQDDDDAKVRIPTNIEIRAYQVAIGDKYSMVSEAYAALDGLNLSIEEAVNDSDQNMFFNGWTHGHYVNSLFLFVPDGKIRGCVLNAPGTFHDSTMAKYGMYERMDSIYRETGGKVVVDSAFNLGTRDCMIQSSNVDPIGGHDAVAVNRDATSVRQLSEWGMRMIQGQFPRMKDPLRYEEFGDRMIILRLLVNLYNFQTGKVGINTILNSYMEGDTGFYHHENISDDANYYLETIE